MRKIFVAIFVISAAVLTSAAQERYLKPVDEGPMDQSFVAFRNKVIAAAERRDARFIYTIVDPKISVSFGGDNGIRGFRKWFKIDKRTDPFWDEFLVVLKNGGLFWREKGKRTNMFYAPYTFQGFPEDLDGFTHGVVFGTNVNLRRTPSTDGEIVSKLSYNIVKAHYEDSSVTSDDDRRPLWVKVTTFGGLTGYVNDEFFRSPIDYRAGFEKKRGVWKMTAFISGD